MAGRKTLFESLNYDDYPDDDDFKQYHILVGHMKLPKINLVFCSELPNFNDVSDLLENIDTGWLSDMVVCEGTLPLRAGENPKFWSKVVVIEDDSDHRRFAVNLDDLGLRVLSADEVNSVIYENISYFDPGLLLSRLKDIIDQYRGPSSIRYSEQVEYLQKVIQDLRTKEKSVYYTGDTFNQALRWDHLYQLGHFHQFN